jgi:hypothetical protein
MDAPAATSFTPLKEVEMQGRNWKLAMLLAATVGVMASASTLALAQSHMGQQMSQNARDPDIARQEPKGLRDPEVERQQPQGLRDAGVARQEPKGLKDADEARQQPQGLRDAERQPQPPK